MLGFTTIQKGQHYLKTYPNIPQLNIIFPDLRIISATKFAVKFMPFLAVFAVFWQQLYAKDLPYAFALAMITALIAITLPLQGFYYLGKRAITPLPHTTRNWYIRIANELNSRNLPTIIPQESNLTYQDLNDLLNKAEKHLPKDYWEEI